MNSYRIYSDNPFNKIGITRGFLAEIPSNKSLRGVISGVRRIATLAMHSDITGEDSEYYARLNGALSELEAMNDSKLQETLKEFLSDGDPDIRRQRWLQEDQARARAQVEEAQQALQRCQEDKKELTKARTHLVEVLFFGGAARPTKKAVLPIGSWRTACCLFRCGKQAKYQDYYFVAPDGRVFTARDKRPLPEFVQHQAKYYSDRAFLTRSEALVNKDLDPDTRIRREVRRGIFHSSKGVVCKLLGSTNDEVLIETLGILGLTHLGKPFGELAARINPEIKQGDRLVLAYAAPLQGPKKKQFPAAMTSISQEVMDIAGPYNLGPSRVTGPYITY